MKAIAFRKTGSVDVLEEAELPKPALTPEKVLVRVVAAGVNPSDTLFRSGGLPFVRLKFPFIPGLEVSGIIEEPGAEVKRFRPGDTVYGMLPNTEMGGYAEYAVLSQDACARIPANLSFAEAAAIPVGALTALQGLQTIAKIKPGIQVLVNGGSGGVGIFAVQIAKALGAHVSTTTSSRNVDMMRELGADEVFDYTRTPVANIRKTFDVVFDAVGLLDYGQANKLLSPGGVGVTVNPLRGNPIAQFRAQFEKKQWRSFFVKPGAADFETLNGWFASGQIHPVLDQTYPLADAAAAQRYSETKRVRGKLVLIVDPDLATQIPSKAQPMQGVLA